MKSRTRSNLLSIAAIGLLLAVCGCSENPAIPAKDLESGEASLDLALDLAPAAAAGYTVTQVTVAIARGDFHYEMDLVVDGEYAEGTFTGLHPGEYSIQVEIYEGDFRIAVGEGRGRVTGDETAVDDYDAIVAVYDRFEGFNSSTQEAFRLCLDGMEAGTRLRFSVRTNGATAYDGTEVVYLFEDFPVNTWPHVVGVFDDGTFTLYLNGEVLEAQTVYASATVGSGDTPLTIGYSVGTNNANDPSQTHFDGIIDEVRVIDQVLVPEEFLQID